MVVIILWIFGRDPRAEKKRTIQRDDSFYFVPEVTQKGNIYFPGHPENKNFNIFTLKKYEFLSN